MVEPAKSEVQKEEARYLGAGDAVDYYPATDRLAGEVVSNPFGNNAAFSGVMAADTLAGEKGELQIEGVFRVNVGPAPNSNTFSYGAIAYWDDSNNWVTNVPSQRPFGRIVQQDFQQNDAFVVVKKINYVLPELPVADGSVYPGP